ncbi:MAG TPA: hypothetical protein VMS60_06400 [Solirubrobacterales bacterium]|nr:hypothetical protein [Solirubrobacterales bacterium]
MSAPLAALPGWVAVLIGISFAVLVILAVVELVRSSRVKCAVRDCLSAAWRALRSLWSLSNFPERSVAMVVLLVVSATMLFLAIGPVIHGPAALGVKASFQETSPAVIETDTAAPTVGTDLSFGATVDPSSDRLAGSAVVVTGPETTSLGECHASTAEETTDGYAHGSQARISLAELGSADKVEFECHLSVERRIRYWEPIELELTEPEAAAAGTGALYLRPPDVALGREKAEALAEREIHTSPADWQESSMRPAPDAFEEQGEEWSLLDPQALHGFRSGPPGLAKTLHQLEDTRVESSKIVTLRTVITSRPVTQDRFQAKGSNRQAIRQVYAVGQKPGEQGGWCTTTRSTAQPRLKKGDRLQIRASVIEWGKSEASDGIAVMLNCPAVKVLGSTGGPVSTPEVGAATVPDRFNR